MRTLLASLTFLLTLSTTAQTNANNVTVYTSDNDHAFGLAFERQIRGAFSAELAVEQRRTTLPFSIGGYDPLDPYHGTLFEKHESRITSTPIELLGRYRLGAEHRFSPFASVGVRYVPKPSQRDLTRNGLLGPNDSLAHVTNRTGLDLGLGASLQLAGHVSITGEVRQLMSEPALSDEKTRYNFGLGYRF